MQRRGLSDGSKAGRVARLRRWLALRQSANWAMAALLLAGLLSGAFLLHAESRTVATTLALQVAEAGQLELQNDNAIVKLRLSPGVAVTLWGDKACAAPPDDSYIITASGTYTIPLSQIKQQRKAAGDDGGSICLLSSDGVLRRSLPMIGGAAVTGTKTSAGKSAPQSTWSGHVSITVARVSSAKTPH